MSSDDIWGDGEPAPRVIHSGSWSITLRGDSISDVTFDGELALRAIRVVVRDHDWRTIPATVESAREEPTPGGLVLRLEVRSCALGVDFAWSGTLTLTDGELRFDFGGRALSAFRRNRVGIVVLHPTSVAGSALIVRHGDADATSTGFPAGISPHQPAKYIAGLQWSTAASDHDLAFRGDVFEMEDQRNWTDASFKTYSTPLSEPFPVQMGPGDVMRQGITLRSHANGLVAQEDAPARVWPLRLLNQGRVVPEFVLGASTAPRDDHAERLPAPLPVLVELDTRAPNWRAALDRAVDDAGGQPLDVRIIAAELAPAELAPAEPTADHGAPRATTRDPIAEVLDALAGIPLVRLGVFDPVTHCSEPGQWRRLRDGATARGIRVPLVGGTRAHFTELNRQHGRLPADADALTFSLTPQMHDYGRDQVIRSVAVQRLVAEESVRIAAGRAVHIGPVTLRPRFNAVATEPPPPDSSTSVDAGYGPEFVWQATDPRQHSPAFAAWLVASVAALSVPGVESITYGEAWGTRGVVGPAATVLNELAHVAGWVLLGPVGELPPDVWAFAGRRGGVTVVFAANLGGEPSTLKIQGADAPDRLITVPPAGVCRLEF